MKNESWLLALRAMANISAWIAFPVIFGLYLGKWLDARFATEPWLFLIVIGACFAVSVYGLIRSVLREFRLENKTPAPLSKSEDNHK